jgi:hypothetical protein
MSLAELLTLLPLDALVKLAEAVAAEIQTKNELAAMQAAAKAADAATDIAEEAALKS